MASPNLPPRQKMINMLYLVLTAMLAMNVSKEVLDAFAIMDADLVRSERAHEQRSHVEYAVFADAADRLPEKFRGKYDQAMRVKAMADSIVHRIDGIKARMISEADGVHPDEITGRDGSGRDTLRALLVLERKDDREVLTRTLVGSEPATPRREPGSAYDIRMRISVFRDSLKALAGDKGAALASALDGLFDFSDRRDASGTLSNWESTSFYDIPLAAGIATLSKLQADVRAAENDMVKWLYRSVEADDYKFGTLTTAVVPQSALVMRGDSFRADVFLAAYDPRNAPTVTLADGSVLPIGPDGKAKLRLLGTTVGEHRVQGMIRFEGPNGVEDVPYSSSFQVMAPLLVASPTKMNVLYRGVDNPIELSVPGVPAERVQASISSGRIVRSGRGWMVNGVSDGTAEVYATATSPDGSTKRIGPAVFRVKDLPTPTAFVNTRSGADRHIKKTELTAARRVTVKLPDTEFEAPFEVLKCTMVVMRGTQPIEKTLPGGVFDDAAKEVLQRLRPGDRIFFEEIKARLADVPNVRTYMVPSIAWKVVD